MSQTPNLFITEIDANQSQKEVTANNAFVELDGAITALLSVAMADADYTLSTTEGGEALGHAAFEFTGTLSATRNIIVPATPKFYAVQNDTSEGGSPLAYQNLVVKTSSGSGVTIAQGSTAYALVYCDGTNVLEVGSSGGGGSGTLAGDSDVDISSPSTGQVLTYNGSQWINQTPSGGGGGGSWSASTAKRQAIINAVLTPLVPGVDSVLIRLYGGWYDSSGLTREGTRITQEVGQNFSLIELKNGRIHSRTNCEMASALIDSPSDILQSTFRKRNGIRSRLASVKTPHCVSMQKCTMSAVVEWSRGGCPESGCPVTPNAAFTYNEQKLVDTLLCCDLLALAGRNPPPPIFVVSDDDDFAPALLMAARLGAAVHLVEMRATKGRVYGNLFGRYNVKTANL